MSGVLPTAGEVRAVLAEISDPEIPVLTIEDLGILRDVEIDGTAIAVTITPTYSGCPAMDQIRADIDAALAAHGWREVTVRMVLAPAWTTEWMTNQGRRKLREYGIAPPSHPAGGPVLLQLGRRAPAAVNCPQCGSADTEELTRFGSTSCKALWRCQACREPFDYFKDH